MATLKMYSPMCSAVAMVIALMMIGATSETSEGGRQCGLYDMRLTNEYVTTSICRFSVRNNCTYAAAFNVVVKCEDRGWRQAMISRFAMEVDVPKMGECTLLPNAFLFPGINYSCIYPCAAPLPLSLLSVRFGIVV
ncbi:hypothetical protein KP509_23G079700 [Ceratopteris richardii]|uniref:Uncharacterized protein n=1 Tax=Ceratopteris richardii TaxID=49495 RepID=A0A8T2S1L1_CERRI|nr:hypothetical protein KP509_23G079700 [Ceratopteris richardii]